MSTRAEAAVVRHGKGYNCSQSVACAFAEDLGLDEVGLFRMAEGLGAGVGDRNGDCGALLGAAVVAGLVTSDGNVDAPASKKETYAKVAQMSQEFKATCGSNICRELRGMDTGVVLTSCDDCIAHAADIAQRTLFS